MTKEDTTVNRYYLLCVSGMYQRWSQQDPKKLTDPVPFEGFVQNVEWGYSIGTEAQYAFKFAKPSLGLIDPKNFGPWWYTVTERRWVEVVETTHVVRTPGP